MKKILLTCFMLVFVLHAWAQDRTVSGTVTDSETGEALPGVNILLKGTGTGITTDLDGNYKISVPSDGGTLVFTFIGMQKQEIPIGSRSVIDVKLDTDVQQLGEVIVTGYKTQTKEKSNISAVTVGAEKINTRPNPSVVQTLSGQIPGLNIATGSGQPGSGSVINLRGVGSINGNTEPLFIIDGTPVDQDNFRSLNPNEIASVSVLKDAGATAIYGNRGANGVVVIETKRGGFDSPLQITYTGQYITSTLQGNDYDLMDSQEQLTLERQYGNGRGASLTDAEIAAAETFNWDDYFFSNGVGLNHNIQLTKGGENFSSYISLGYLDQEGILQNSSLERYNVRSNINGKSEDSKFTYGLNLSVNYSDNQEPNNIGGSGINRNPVLAAYQSVPYITADDYTTGADLVSPLSFANTPLFIMDLFETFTRTEDEIKGLGTLNLGYEIIDGLSINSRTSADFESENLIRTQGPESFNSILFAESGNTTPGFSDQNLRQSFTINQLTSINFNRTFANKHNVSAGLFTEYYKANLYSFGFFADGLDPKTFYPGDGSGFIDDNSANDYFTDQARANILSLGLLSYFGQVDYDYDSKYGLGLTLRRDASSRFTNEYQWGTFYSVSGRWNIHNETFMEGLPFDILKLRGSYGTNGNQQIVSGSIFNGVDLYRPLFATGTGYTGANSIFLSQIPNSQLRWETVAQSNIAIDAELFKSRLRTTVEGYIKTTTDLYQENPVSSVNGVTLLDSNIGSLENKGFDLQINYDIIRKSTQDGLNLTLNLVGNYNKQEITELPGGEEELIGTGRIGGKLFEYYDYRYAGVNPANGNLLFLTAEGEVTENPNPDTDRVWLDKNIYPDYQGSFGFDLDFKGFFVTTQFNYVLGVDRYDFDYSGFVDPTAIGQFRHSRDMLRAWTPDNRFTDMPSINATNVDLDGTRFLKDASYLRLRFLSFGYNVPKEWMDVIGLRMGRVFVNGENLFTETEWRGYDAEALNNTSRLYPTPRTITVGVELGF